MATATQGTFVSRTRNYVPDLNSYSTTHAVGPSSTYNATGSNFKPSAFFIQAGRTRKCIATNILQYEKEKKIK